MNPCPVAHQVPLSMEFPKQEYWSGLPFPSPGDLPDPGIGPTSALAGILYHWATNVYRSFICINPKLGGAKTYKCPLTAEWVNKLWYILLNRIELSSIEDDRLELNWMEFCLQNWIPLSPQNEWTTDTHNSMDDSQRQKHYNKAGSWDTRLIHNWEMYQFNAPTDSCWDHLNSFHIY